MAEITKMLKRKNGSYGFFWTSGLFSGGGFYTAEKKSANMWKRKYVCDVLDTREIFLV